MAAKARAPADTGATRRDRGRPVHVDEDAYGLILETKHELERERRRSVTLGEALKVVIQRGRAAS